MYEKIVTTALENAKEQEHEHMLSLILGLHIHCLVFLITAIIIVNLWLGIKG